MKAKIIISPYAKKLRNGNENPKNYPLWKELISLLKKEEYYIAQVGISEEKTIDGVDEVIFDRPLDELKKILLESNTFIGVDNFFQHFAAMIGKPGIVIFGKSDPNIFGHVKNLNLLKNRSYLRENQFCFWEDEKCDKECFISPEEIMISLKKFLYSHSKTE